MSMSPAAVSAPQVSTIDHAERLAFLRRVLMITVLGLTISGVTGIASMFALTAAPFLLSGYAPMITILACWGVANFLAPRFVFGNAKWGGFLLGTVADGIALGFLLLTAVLVSRVDFGNPFYLIGMALLLTALSGAGLTAYALVERREFKLLRAGLSALFIPMLVIMGISFAFPNLLSGTAGVLVSGLFVLVSVGGLLYQLNKVIHDFNTDMHIEGGYVITLGVLVLFWNILTFLMRAGRR